MIVTWTPPDEPDREPLPAHTPIPRHVDKRIERLALELARCRSDLTPQQQLHLASVLAYRTRVYRTSR
jgi:hypothetical protein